LKKYILVINSEGAPLREIDDLEDEPRMMIYFKERQQRVLTELRVELGHMLDKSVERRKQLKVKSQQNTSQGSPPTPPASPTSKLKSGIDPWTITRETRTGPDPESHTNSRTDGKFWLNLPNLIF
jgi:hypothetical protein